MEMIHVLEDALLPADNHIVYRAQVLSVFGQAHATRMGRWGPQTCALEAKWRVLN